MLDNLSILKKLIARQGYSFHTDRQLGDEILLQSGWTVGEDPSWEGGYAWTLRGPDGAKIVTVAETTRPHPVIDLDAAFRQVPRDVAWACGYVPEREAFVASVGAPIAITHNEAPIALMIALFNFKLGGTALEELGYKSESLGESPAA